MPTNKTNNFNLFEKEREYANPMVASITDHLVNLRKKNIAASLSDFEGSAHKLEHVKTLRRVDFIDDARSVNANSVWFALQSMTKPTIWINNISSPDRITDDVMDLVQEKVKAIVLQGVYNTDVYDRFSSLGIPVFVEMNLEDAVSQAFYAAEGGYAVLYSPGEKSLSQDSYRERGEKFQEAVGQL